MRDISRLPPGLRRWLPLLILLLAALVTFVLIKTKQEPAAREAQLKRWNVQVVQLQPISAHPELELYGQLEAPQLTRLSSALNADVHTLIAREGDTLAKGTPLLLLDPRETELQLRQRQAELASVAARIAAEHNRHRNDQRSLKLEQEVQVLNEDRVRRAESLHTRKLLSQEQLDNTRLTTRQQALAIRARQQAIADHPNRLAQLEAEQARIQALVDSAELDLSRTRILAPFNARVVSIDTAQGNRVRPGDRLLTLYDLDRLQLRAQVPEQLLPLLRSHLHTAASPKIPDDQGSSLEPINSPEPATSHEQANSLELKDSLELKKNPELTASAQLNGQPLNLQLDRLAARIGQGQAGVDALFSLHSPDTHPVPGQTLNLRLQLPLRSDLYALPPSALYGHDRLYRLAAENRLQAV